ncbi:PSD1 and planctomycete cytochrome C domain-containing protein [Schlesneria sp. DSM 10557]|uniref:PSD1 and planctomycete cytochrome C domain-containing protein n=1 Tax=Schlesneria sp. DSM 10557 TaxID=3044399 RepID=UPI00359F90CB
MIGVLLSLLLAAEEPAALQSPTTEQLQFFESDVRPVLVEHCQKCHGPQKEWAGLRVDSRDALLRGGDSGAAIVPGEPDKSLLIRAIRHDDPDLKMPEDGKLTDRQIANLVRWVEMGAPFPASQPANVRTRNKDHWAFQPLIPAIVPEIQNKDAAEAPVDPYILARLEALSLPPAALADRNTLIRRVTYDLIGLPPTPKEIASYVSDDRPDALERVVDRLLASPAYGERWGRHWLDVARYADSNGLDENIAHGNAWKYRDYVIDSFNRDKPLDRFIVEQLAGDLLSAGDETQRHEQLIATGLISIGPKVLAEVNEAKMRMDIIDEQIDTVGRVFLGLTLGCARCHDHKFDPIDTADYYGLAGIFKSTRTMETYTKVAKWHEHLLPSAAATQMQAQYDADLALRKKAVEEFVAKTNLQVRETLDPQATPPESLESLYPEAAAAELKKLREELAALEKSPPELPAAMGVTEDQVTDVAIQIRGNPLKLGEVVPRRTPPVIRSSRSPEFAATESGRRQLADWLIEPSHPLTSRVVVNRIWRWHFGQGLVRTTDNFGLLGEVPSHPELLDWVAQRFVADGWSQKKLHRLLLSSSTYRRSSLPSEDLVAHDPENRLLGRASLRRLDAEEIRDSLLSVSGQLDTMMGGSLLKVKNRGYLFDHTSIDLSDYSSRRRSLYLPVIRNNVYDVFQLLNFPDPAVPTGDRTTTTVAPQALLMMNSDLVMQSAEQFAAQVLAMADEDKSRIDRLYATAYARSPSAEERRDSLDFLSRVKASLEQPDSAEAERDLKAWGILCHTMLASNEFIYLK